MKKEEMIKVIKEQGFEKQSEKNGLEIFSKEMNGIKISVDILCNNRVFFSIMKEHKVVDQSRFFNFKNNTQEQMERLLKHIDNMMWVYSRVFNK